jgi:hypothetical protein
MLSGATIGGATSRPHPAMVVGWFDSSRWAKKILYGKRRAEKSLASTRNN